MLEDFRPPAHVVLHAGRRPVQLRVLVGRHPARRQRALGRPGRAGHCQRDRLACAAHSILPGACLLQPLLVRVQCLDHCSYGCQFPAPGSEGCAAGSTGLLGGVSGFETSCLRHSAFDVLLPWFLRPTVLLHTRPHQLAVPVCPPRRCETPSLSTSCRICLWKTHT